MKRYIFVIFILFVNMNLFSQEAFEFRGYKWGTNSNTIIKTEGTPDEIIDMSTGLNSNILFSFPGTTVLHYSNKKVSIYNSELSFSFFDDKLDMAEYKINGKSSYIDYIADIYLDLRNKLKSLYGEYNISFMGEYSEKKDDEVKNRITKNINEKNKDDKKWYTIHKTNWYYKDTSIKMDLFYNIYMKEYSIKIEYISRQYNNNLDESVRRREQLKKSMEGL